MRIAGLLLSLTMTLLLVACSGKEASSPCRVAVSFEPQARLLRQIAGDDIDIVTLIPPGSNPETYQPTISVMKNLADASAYLTLGTPGFEKSIGDKVSENFPGLRVEDTSEGIEKIYGTHSGPGTSGDSYDPHLMNSVRNCIRIAENMTRILTELYPQKEREYAEAGARLKERLANLDKELSEKNLKGKNIVVRHPVLSYFARDYGIGQTALEREGKEPTPLQLSSRIDEIRKSAPSLAVAEKSGNNSLERQVAEDLGIKMIEVNLSSEDWIDELKRIADEIDRNKRHFDTL